MKRIAIFAVWFLGCHAALSGDSLSDAVKLSPSDLGAIKVKAEAGDAGAQLSLADALAANLKSLEALGWYRKAADQGAVVAKRRVGEMLLFGEAGVPAINSVKANPPEGIRWTFAAATNQDAKACLNMATALQTGRGVNTNLVEAYAWLTLDAEKDPVGKNQLNQLALKLDVAGIQQGKKLAAEFKANKWHEPPAIVIPEADSMLRLSGLSIGSKLSLAIINGKSVAEGESVAILLKERALTIQCLHIKEGLAQVQVEGESEPRWLVEK